MRQSKFSLADVLTVLTTLAFGFVCFLGKNFSTLGDTYESIIWWAAIAVSLAGTAYIAKLLKRTSRNFKINFILEIIVLLLFTGLTIYFAYSPFPQYFNVSAKKTEIQNKLQTSITHAQDMFPEYERYAENRKSNYKGQLATAVATKLIDNKYVACGFENGNVPDSVQTKNKIFTIHTLLFPSYYTDSISKKGIKEVATAWLAKGTRFTNSWNPIGIVHVVNDIEKKSEDWKNKLMTFSQFREKCEDEKVEDFQYKLTLEDVKTYFTTVGKPTRLSIGLAAGAYMLMLFSYLISKRSSKTTIGTTKKKGKYDIDF